MRGDCRPPCGERGVGERELDRQRLAGGDAEEQVIGGLDGLGMADYQDPTAGVAGAQSGQYLHDAAGRGGPWFAAMGKGKLGTGGGVTGEYREGVLARPSFRGGPRSSGAAGVVGQSVERHAVRAALRGVAAAGAADGSY